MDVIELKNSDWAALVVVVKKINVTVRLCTDYPIGLNEALESNNYPSALNEHLITKLNGGRYIAKLDISHSYLQFLLSDECEDILKVNMHNGLIR